MDQKCLPSWRNPARYPTSHDADVFVHASHLMGGVHQRGGRRAAYRAAHRGAVGPERSGRSILKITSLCRCAGPQEAAFCVLRAMRHRGAARVCPPGTCTRITCLTTPPPRSPSPVRPPCPTTHHRLAGPSDHPRLPGAEVCGLRHVGAASSLDRCRRWERQRGL